MAKRDMIPLAAPYHSIYVNATHYRWGVHVEYLSPSLELLRDAKCLTRGQLALLRKPSPGKSRNDSDGDDLIMHKKPTKSSPNRVRVVMRIKSSDEKALALPGVRGCLVVRERPDDDRSRAYAQGVAVRIGAKTSERSRPVGRFQRPVEWTAVGNVIVPNWQKVKTDWMLQRAINNTPR